MRSLFGFVMTMLEAPSRIRLLEGEVAHLRRQVGAHARLLDGELMARRAERAMERGRAETHAALAGATTTTPASAPEGGQS